MDDPASLDKVAALLTGPDGQCLIYCPQCDFSVAKYGTDYQRGKHLTRHYTSFHTPKDEQYQCKTCFAAWSIANVLKGTHDPYCPARKARPRSLRPWNKITRKFEVPSTTIALEAKTNETTILGNPSSTNSHSRKFVPATRSAPPLRAVIVHNVTGSHSASNNHPKRRKNRPNFTRKKPFRSKQRVVRSPHESWGMFNESPQEQVERMIRAEEARNRFKSQSSFDSF